MTAGAVSEPYGLGCIGKEDALLAFHPLAGGSIKPPEDYAAAMAGKGEGAAFQLCVEIGIGDVGMADHRV